MPGPDPDHPEKPSSPLGIAPQTWKYVCERTVREFVRDGCVDAAAGLTFFSVLSIFPALLAIIALIGIFSDGSAAVDRLLSLLSQVAPGAATETLRVPLAEIADAPTAGITLVVAVATALWSSSVYVSAFGRAQNRIYGVEEGRPYWKRKPSQIAVTALLMILVMIIGVILILSRPVAREVGSLFRIGDSVLTAWDILKWPLLAVAVVAMVTVLYKGTSNLRQPRFRWLGLGAALAIILLGLASAGFAFYVSYVASYNQTFGALAGVIVFLLWLFIINLALLGGAEFNAELERGRQLAAGLVAEVDLQLPRRDTTLSDRTRRSARITESRGALLRQGEELPKRTDTIIARTRRFFRAFWRRVTRG